MTCSLQEKSKEYTFFLYIFIILFFGKKLCLSFFCHCRAKADLKKDIDRAKQLANLKELDVKDVSMLLFGKPIVNKTQQLLNYVALARKYLPTIKKLKGTEKQKNPPRFKGQNIYFPFHYRYPKFLLRKAIFSAATAAGEAARHRAQRLDDHRYGDRLP